MCQTVTRTPSKKLSTRASKPVVEIRARSSRLSAALKANEKEKEEEKQAYLNSLVVKKTVRRKRKAPVEIKKKGKKGAAKGKKAAVKGKKKMNSVKRTKAAPKKVAKKGAKVKVKKVVKAKKAKK